MFKDLSYHIVAVPILAVRLIRAIPAEGWRHAWKRLLIFTVGWCFFSVLNLLHVLGHALDEVLFRGYRHVAVKDPIFIVGIPRSGTTFLQRLLSNHEQLTTFSTWEAVLAPSVSEKYLYAALGKAFKPITRLFSAARNRLLSRMDNVHEIHLHEPEEDFLLLAPLNACFLLAFICPNSPHYWKLGRFDETMTPDDRERVAKFYARCVQKHLHFHGTQQRFLSKNPSFTGWMTTLRAVFPTAQFIVCHRRPAQAIPSQLSAFRPAMALLGNGNLSPVVKEKLIEMLVYYYERVGRVRQRDRYHMVSNSRLRHELKPAVHAVIEFIGLSQSDRFARTVAVKANEARKQTGQHRYCAADFALSERQIEQRFKQVWPMLESTRHAPTEV